jgi:hypothetical protein
MAHLFSQWLLAAVVNIVHPFYVSVTEINHNAKDNTMEISCKLFTDDFEKTLSAQYKTPVDLGHPKNKEQADKMVFTYLQQHLQLKIDGKTAVLQYVGYENEGEAAWCYLQVSNAPVPKQLQLNANMLYELFDTQINIIHATVNGKRQSTKITNPQASATFSF